MMEQCKEKLSIAMFGQKRIPSREGGVEIVVEELCTRMVAQGHNVTCYNRGGHHVSGSEYDSKRLKEYKGIKLKTVPTISTPPSLDGILFCPNIAILSFSLHCSIIS